MSKQPLGKTLLRNVIRHTDAHNKIQEEMEMWKMRDWENQKSHHRHLSDTHCVRGRIPDPPREGVSEHDDRDARYWSRKLYDFKASDPDRWGHSGFKELYPEEFKSDGERNSATKKIGRHKMKRSKSDTEGSLYKRSKKSSRKKKKKKKKVEEDKRKKAEFSSSSDDSSAAKDKQRKRAKSRHKNKKTAKNRGKNEDGSSGNSDDERERERRTRRSKKRKEDSNKDSGPNSKKKRKTWKAAGQESSDDTSGD